MAARIRVRRTDGLVIEFAGWQPCADLPPGFDDRDGAVEVHHEEDDDLRVRYVAKLLGGWKEHTLKSFSLEDARGRVLVRSDHTAPSGECEGRMLWWPVDVLGPSHT